MGQADKILLLYDLFSYELKYTQCVFMCVLYIYIIFSLVYYIDDGSHPERRFIAP